MVFRDGLQGIWALFQPWMNSALTDAIFGHATCREFLVGGTVQSKPLNTQALERSPYSHGSDNFHSDSFVGFIRSSRAYTHAKYGGHSSTALSWNNLVADYLNVQTAKSTEGIDKRPMLNVPLKVSGQDGPRGLKILNVDGIVCLKRTDTQQIRSVESPSQSTIAHNRDNAAGQPTPKRRKVFDSSFLNDMMAG